MSPSIASAARPRRRGTRGPRRDPVKARLLRLYVALERRFGPQRWWPGRTAYEVAVGAVLTQHTAWTNAARAVAALRALRLLRPRRLAALGEAELARAIRAAGTPRVKARRLRALTLWLLGRFGGAFRPMRRLPLAPLRRELLAVPGLGPETADAILLYGAERPVFVADAYARRVLVRHRLLRRPGGPPGPPPRARPRASLGRVPPAARASTRDSSPHFCQQADQACIGVGDRERHGARAHVFQAAWVGEEGADRGEEARGRELDLRQHDRAAGALDEARVQRLLVPAGPRQRDVERRQAELAALVQGAGPRACHEERRGRVNAGELRAHVRHDRVACPERRRERGAPGLEPLTVAGRRVVAALVDDLRALEQRRKRVPDSPVDPLGSLCPARDIDER